MKTEENNDSVLDQFRQQWREEVSARNTQRKKPHSGNKDIPQTGPVHPVDAPGPSLPPSAPQSAFETRDKRQIDQSQEGEDQSDLIDGTARLTLGNADDDGFSKLSTKEPESALEHYERAVEKEGQGSLGASLSHYRKAYRLDASVDQSYKLKHFPPTSKPSSPNPSNAPATIPSTAHHSLKDPDKSIPTIDVVRCFAGVAILGEPPTISGDRPPPCPISQLPSEILNKILLETAILDPALYARLTLVCKRLAYHVFMENQIWKRVALGAEFGLASNIYEFKTDIQGREVIHQLLGASDGGSLAALPVVAGQSQHEQQDWRQVFHSHPRIRFTGVYISTVNYTRAGGASASQATWGSPVHIVTYYRYLRFFRDGTVISLLSTTEPIEVVHHLTKENVSLARSGKEHHPLNSTSSAPATNGTPASGPPATAHQLMKYALRGRWRLDHPAAAGKRIPESDTTVGGGITGDVCIETEGPGPRYLYTMHLALTSSTRSKQGVKNNRLQWKAFWSYNQLSNDWAPFQLKNDKPFFFSRVRSYGLGQ